MSAKLTKTIAALGFAALMGCEAVAGIRDLAFSGSSQEGGAPTSGGDATTEETSGNDAAETPEAAGDDTGSTPDSNDATTVADVADALSEAVSDAGTDGETGAAVGMKDGAAEAEAAGGVGASDAEAGVVSYTVPIPGPDGGALTGGDSGALMGELIDDMEADNGRIIVANGRNGPWFTYSDTTDGGMETPAQGSMAMQVIGAIMPPRGSSMFAAHMSGSGFAMFAGFGLNLNDPSGPILTYDGRAYRGFVFWGRLGAVAGTATIEFAVPDGNTSSAGSVCAPVAKCNDDFAKNLTFSTNWQQFTVLYTDLKQQGWGLPQITTGLDAAHIYSCHFQVLPPASLSGFDLWIDDIYFIDK